MVDKNEEGIRYIYCDYGVCPNTVKIGDSTIDWSQVNDTDFMCPEHTQYIKDAGEPE